MANLRYCDKHNMVAFLKKPTESESFTEIVDFLKGSSLRYALTHNPTIYDSLVKQFWQTATVRTLANRIPQIIASIDNKEYIVTEASVRSNLQLADATGINNLPDADIYDGLTTLGNRAYNFSKLIFDGMRGYAGDHVPLLPAMLADAVPDQDEATTTRVGVDTEGATTTISGLDAGLDSGNIHESPLRSHDTPLHEGHTSGSVEDSVKLQELMVLVPKLNSKVDSLENELKETKQTLGGAILTLVKKVKSLENFVPMKAYESVKRQGVQPEQELSKKQKIEDIPEEKIVKPIMKRGKRKKQIARKGKHIDKTAMDEAEEEREEYMKDKVKGASSESKEGIDAIPTDIKPPSIIDWKIIPQAGLRCVYQIIGRDGTDKIYTSFGAILKDFTRDELTELYRLVMKKYGENRPEEMYDNVLWGNLKTMFDPHLIHCLTLDASRIYMLADRKYPLSKDVCQVMIQKKLLDGVMDDVCYQLLKMIEKQAGLR
ncbi:hypothetical protein Tco_1522801 [Tanacetum coccineum]